MMAVSKLVIAGLAALGIGAAGVAVQQGAFSGASEQVAPAGKLAVSIATAGGVRRLVVERAVTAAEQQRGLMYRTDLGQDGGMMFWPYPAGGGGPRAASFWMKNTPTPLDIVFIRPDGTIARIAENTVPFSEDQVPSGEPVDAVLEIVGGRAAALGVAEGDRVTWDKRTPAR